VERQSLGAERREQKFANKDLLPLVHDVARIRSARWNLRGGLLMRSRALVNYAVTLLIALGSCGLLGPCAWAQSLCDVLPASAVKATLGLAGDLSAKPNTEGGNGCDYKGAAVGPTTVIADSSDDGGMVRMIFDQRMKMLGSGGQAISGVGDAAYYEEKRNQQIPRFPGQEFTQQSLVFRAKGKIVSFIVMTPGNGLSKPAILALGGLAISKPINTLKDPS